MCRFFVQQLQGNAHKIWFSTGVFDREYPPSKILALVRLFEGVRAHALPVTPAFALSSSVRAHHRTPQEDTLECPLHPQAVLLYDERVAISQHLLSPAAATHRRGGHLPRLPEHRCTAGHEILALRHMLRHARGRISLCSRMLPRLNAHCAVQTRRTWPKCTYNLQFLIPHTLGDPLERIDTIRWWLGLGNYEQFLSLAQLRAIGSIG